MAKHMHNSLIFLFLMAIITLGCTPRIIERKTSMLEGDKQDRYTAYVNKGLSLVNKRSFKKALENFEAALTINPQDPEAHYFKGLALFRMDEYVKASNAFKTVLEMSSDHYRAQHWLWASRLEESQSSKIVKEAVQKEIGQLIQGNKDNPGSLFAAYMGYLYLDKREDRVPLIKKLAKMRDEELENSIAAYLLEEIFGENNPLKRIELADLYISSFPDKRNAQSASGALFFTIENVLEDEAMLQKYMDKYTGKGNIHLNRSIAACRIKKEWDLNKAVNLLKANLEEIEKPEAQKKPELMTDEEWENILKEYKADYLYLLGTAYFKKDNLKTAKTYLEKSNILYDRNERVYLYLAKIAIREDKKEEAVLLLKRSLEIGDSSDENSTLLDELLKTVFDYEGSSAKYFSKLEGINPFSDATKQSGLENVKSYRITWGDYNNDGYVDAIFDGPRLFKNNKGSKFEEVTEEAGLGKLSKFNGAVWGDYNNDGYLDIFLISHKTNQLLKNNKRGSFVNVTEEAFSSPQENPTEAAAWGDINNDGFLDIYVTNYERQGVVRGLGSKDRLFKNNGNGTFEDITDRAGIASDENMCGRDVVWSDFNNDGFQDIFVSNYRLDPNFLWINRGNSTFVNGAEEKNVIGNEVDGDYGHTTGSIFGDIDNDGNLDLLSVNLAHPRYIEFSDRNMLLLNSSHPSYTFKDVFKQSGISFEETNVIPALGDIDNDGDLDLYITSIYPGRNSHLYLNDGKGRFSDISWLSETRVKNAWGCAFADYDNDGDLDLLVASMEGIRLFENNLKR